MPSLTIPTPFRSYTGGNKVFEFNARDVNGAIDEFLGAFPALRNHLIAEDGSLRPFINLSLNGEDIRYLQGLGTELQEEDKLQIIPSIAGGRITAT